MMQSTKHKLILLSLMIVLIPIINYFLYSDSTNYSYIIGYLCGAIFMFLTERYIGEY